MRAGLLRHRVTIERATAAQDAYGQSIKTWTTAGKRWASIQPVNANERMFARKANEVVSHILQLRWDSDLGVSPTDRVSFDGRTFQIEAVLNLDERRRIMELHCQEVV